MVVVLAIIEDILEKVSIATTVMLVALYAKPAFALQKVKENNLSE